VPGPRAGARSACIAAMRTVNRPPTDRSRDPSISGVPAIPERHLMNWIVQSATGVPALVDIIEGVLVVLALYTAWRSIFYIRNDNVGIVEKLWSLSGSVENGFMSLDGRAGFRPEVLRGGVHFLVPFQYRVHKQPLVTVPQGTMAYVFARGGLPLQPGQTLAIDRSDLSFENTRAFLVHDGQRGPQRRILREGVYAINTAQFIVFTANGTHAVELSDASIIDEMRAILDERGAFEPVVIRGQDDSIGVVIVHDGPALEHDEIIAPTVGTNPAHAEGFHNSFQDAERFLAAGGRRGRQEQVLVEGTYFINRLFATIEILPKTIIEIGKVGVVVSYTGPHGVDLSGSEYKHGELVEKGRRGVWQRPLQPGKYAINPYALKAVPVPTTNFVLRWVEGRSEEHGFDRNLSEIRLITKDAFEPILPLSIVLHIAYEDAPWVIQQFADLKLLVEQTLDPMVSAYFKDAAQSKTLIELVSQRAELQREAVEQMKERFQKYKLNVMEVMIGTPRAAPNDKHIDTVFEQLRARQVAKEQLATYDSQRVAAEKERELREAEATAKAQSDLTRSAIQIEVAQNQGAAELRRKQQEAEATKVTAEATAMRTRTEGLAEADKIAAVGEAGARSTKAQVGAFGGPSYQLAKEIAMMLEGAIRDAKVPLVPSVTLGGTGERAGSPIDAMLGLLLKNGGLSLPAPGGALPPQI